jgi:transcriptional regulator with XRE-family HTH domain
MTLSALERHRRAEANRRAARGRILDLARQAGIKPSLGAIARAAGVSTSTVAGAVAGSRSPSTRTLEGIAKALRLTGATLRGVLAAGPGWS